MGVTLTLVDLTDPDARSCFVDFMTSESFPMHSGVSPSRHDVLARIDAWSRTPDACILYRVDVATTDAVGFVRLMDPLDDTPTFDIRLAKSYRGQGIGTDALRMLTQRVFTEIPGAHRLEGVTRVDNEAMQRAMVRTGFVKEAHYRLGWPTENRRWVDAVAYAILRQDWESSTTTPVPWDGSNE